MEINAALSAVATASELLKLIVGAGVDHAIRDKTHDLLTEVIALQQLVMTALEDRRAFQDKAQQLQAEIESRDRWIEETARYALHAPAPGVLVYQKKPDAEPREPLHWICANCYQDRKKSILQRESKMLDGTHYRCHRCRCEVIDHTDYAMPCA